MPQSFDWKYVTGFTRWLKDKNGVYVFYDVFSNVLYVGMSKNLQRRLRGHSYGNTHVDTTRVTRCEVYITDSVSMADMLETYLIRELKPEFNLSKADYPEFKRDLDEKLAEIDYSVESIQYDVDEIVEELTDEDDEERDLGEDLYKVREIAQLHAELKRLKRLAALYKSRGGTSLDNRTVEQMIADEEKRRSAAYLAIRSGGGYV